MGALGGHAVFLSAGGYHHHLGANTWESAGAPPAPEGTARLRRTTLVLPDVASRDRLAAQAARAGFPVTRQDDSVGLTDPSGNPLLLPFSRSAVALGSVPRAPSRRHGRRG